MRSLCVISVLVVMRDPREAIPSLLKMVENTWRSELARHDGAAFGLHHAAHDVSEGAARQRHVARRYRLY